MKRLRFSRAALRDRDIIIDYTIENFGMEQALRLRAAFATALAGLQRLPGTGRLRPDIGPNGRQIRSLIIPRSFLVIYEVVDNTISVARILHMARDLPSEIQSDDGGE